MEGGLAPRNYLLPTLGKHTYEPRMFSAPYAWVHPQSRATASHNPSMSELELSNKPTAQVRQQAKTEVPNSKSQQIQNPTSGSRIRILCIPFCHQLCHQPMQYGTRATTHPPPFSLNKHVSSANYIPSTVLSSTNMNSVRLPGPRTPAPSLPGWFSASPPFSLLSRALCPADSGLLPQHHWPWGNHLPARISPPAEGTDE